MVNEETSATGVEYELLKDEKGHLMALSLALPLYCSSTNSCVTRNHGCFAPT